MLLLLFGCIQESDTGEFSCFRAPEVTYHNFGDAFLRHNCQGCHASTAEDRYGAPEFVNFDSVEQAWNWRDRILATTIGDYTSMPPAGTVTADEQVMLYWWLECGKEGE